MSHPLDKHWEAIEKARIAALTKVINALDDLAKIAYALDAEADREKYLGYLQNDKTERSNL